MRATRVSATTGLGLGLGIAGAAVLAVAAPQAGAATKPPATAKARLSAVTATGARLRLTGTVRLPAGSRNSALTRGRVRVAVEVRGASGAPQRFTAPIDAARRYDVRKTTKLRGTLTVSVRARYRGKGYGAARKLAIAGIPSPAALSSPTTNPGTGAPAATGSPAGRAPLANGKLVGLFRFDPGTATQGADGTYAYSGTYFRMIQPGGSITQGPFLENGTSSAPDKRYTFLRPGADGGLRTDRYQPGSTPLYDGSDVLTRSITEREPFFGPLFTVYTEPEDDQAKLPDPLPEIVNTNGTLTGQTTAWLANWNRQGTFNQGSPKPDGSSPGKTTPVRGTIDAAPGRYALEWSSEIVGGPFNSFGGYWHLEGTFEPAA